MINDQIKEEKPKYGISKEAEKILALSSGKIDKYKYLTGEKISYFNQKQITEQAKSTYLPLGKSFEKETKSVNDTGKNKLRVYTLQNLLISNLLLPRINSETTNELERDEEEQKVDKSKMLYKGYNKTYGFRKFKVIGVFYNNVRNIFTNMNMTNDEQNHLAKYIKEFKSKTIT